MRGRYFRHILNFKRPSGTSRGVLTTKETWYLILEEKGRTGIGECGILRTLSIDDRPDYEDKLIWLCDHLHLEPHEIYEALKEFPSIVFGWEQALLSLRSESPFILFPSDFTAGKQGIPINGLIWMGDPEFMQEQISDKLKEGFSCIKMKIGAIDFDTEVRLLKEIRKKFGREDVELRVDANGAFSEKEALKKLEILSRLDLHSIEQPIKAGNPEAMEKLCRNTPLPIALDEELIGVFDYEDRKSLLTTVKPQYIILKPSLVGGFKSSDQWIDLAGEVNAGWWLTSALESNIGLNAIAQYTYEQKNPMPQGLGTGSLFTNNIEAPLRVDNGLLSYNAEKKWDLPAEWGVTF
ncbi:o-succinylbenzoate synthase [Robertkochia marina]|uniref:O-succinylbenzoate synthase n=1 Tax=Robertkochia marina TaxID=1227945 RepID=A0A4S3M2R4_9FLAO|nr:o-succinylbenzoate synthase [Robertkochia marina]THD67775.1 o-succinylbenzoate synthase [Robertkochia marina]TRZ41749.1 o-succinylbenzoate synthase [Robertkochia marina]